MKGKGRLKPYPLQPEPELELEPDAWVGEHALLITAAKFNGMNVLAPEYYFYDISNKTITIDSNNKKWNSLQHLH